MRGVYSIGALAELEELGLRDAFSVVVGSSAGAINGAYFLARQAREGVDIYIENLSRKQFISPVRAWKIVDIDYLVDVALKQAHPLNQDELLAAPAELLTVLTEAKTGTSRVISSRDGFDPYEVMRATSAMPSLYNKQVELDGGLYIDGGVANQVPLDVAFESGASEALVVLTRDIDFRHESLGKPVRFLGRMLARNQSPVVKNGIGQVDTKFVYLMDRLGHEKHESTRRVTWTVAPPKSDELADRMTTDMAKLRDTAEMGRRNMRSMLDEIRTVVEPH